MSKRTEQAPHSTQSALWDEFADLSPGVKMYPADTDGIGGTEFQLIINLKNEAEGRAALLAIRALRVKR